MTKCSAKEGSLVSDCSLKAAIFRVASSELDRPVRRSARFGLREGFSKSIIARLDLARGVDGEEFSLVAGGGWNRICVATFSSSSTPPTLSCQSGRLGIGLGAIDVS